MYFKLNLRSNLKLWFSIAFSWTLSWNQVIHTSLKSILDSKLFLVYLKILELEVFPSVYPFIEWILFPVSFRDIA